VNEPDGERTGRSANRMPMVLLGVQVGVKVEVAVAPTDEQAEREKDDESRDGRLSTLLESLREVALREEDRDAEDDERDAMTDAPPCAELRSGASDALAPRCDERRHRRDVIRVGRVPETKEGRDEEDDSERGSVRETCDPVVEPEHALCSSARRDRFG